MIRPQAKFKFDNEYSILRKWNPLGTNSSPYMEKELDLKFTVLLEAAPVGGCVEQQRVMQVVGKRWLNYPKGTLGAELNCLEHVQQELVSLKRSVTLGQVNRYFS
jgi:hypothetical protein